MNLRLFIPAAFIGAVLGFVVGFVVYKSTTPVAGDVGFSGIMDLAGDSRRSKAFRQELLMRKILIATVLAVLTTAVTALTTNIVATPFDLLRSWWSNKPSLGAEVHVILPDNSGFIITQTTTGTNFQWFK
jgi:uncharacterized membrane protein (Fun14 family)